MWSLHIEGAPHKAAGWADRDVVSPANGFTGLDGDHAEVGG
ncbi:hypothetical protein Z947_454 [Sulfitobacter geojensis]|nr:hypothetical protein Z947_454 [Sulfitobacter geojensis]